MKSGTIKKKKSVRRKTAAPKTVVRQSYILRKRRLLAMLWNRVNEIEKRVPKSLDEAVELSRQSRRWRKRLARFTKLKTTAFPAYALLVDCWGKSLLLGAGTRKKMEDLINSSESVRNAGYKLVCLSELMTGSPQIDKMAFAQGKEGLWSWRLNRKPFLSTGKLLGNWKNLETTIKDGSVLISSLGVTIGEAETMFAARPKMLLNSTPCLSVTLGRSEPRAGRGYQWKNGIAVIVSILDGVGMPIHAAFVALAYINHSGNRERKKNEAKKTRCQKRRQL